MDLRTVKIATVRNAAWALSNFCRCAAVSGKGLTNTELALAFTTGYLVKGCLMLMHRACTCSRARASVQSTESFIGRGQPSPMLHVVRPSLPVLAKLMATTDDGVLHPIRPSSLRGRRPHPSALP